MTKVFCENVGSLRRNYYLCIQLYCIMEIYEEKHLFSAALNVAIYLCMVVFGIVLLSIGREAWWRFPEWEWYCSLVVGALLLIAGTGLICYKIYRYIDLCMARVPAVITSDDELQIYKPFGENTAIKWSEIVDFKVVYTKDRHICYPVYKDDNRNKGRYLFLNLYSDAILSDHLSISEDELLQELKSHL